MRDDERLDDLQFAGLKILQKTSGFRYGMDAVLLSDFAQARRNDAVADFGTGTGILPLLLWGRGKGSSFDCFELQAGMAEMAQRTTALNGLMEYIRVHHASVTDAPNLLPRCSLDMIVPCPPATHRCCAPSHRPRVWPCWSMVLRGARYSTRASRAMS